MTVPTFLPYHALIRTAGIVAAVLIGLNRRSEITVVSA